MAGTLTRDAQRLADAATGHHRDGSLDEAEQGYRAALALDPLLPDGLHGMGLLALARSMPAQAIALIGKALGLRPNHALYTLNLGHALRARGHLEEARAAFSAASLLDPGDPRAPAALALLLEQLSRPDEAVRSARLALDRAAVASDAPGMQALIGRAALASGDWPEAIARLEQAVVQTPDDVLSWHGLAVAQAALGRRDEAERCFRRVVALRPEDPAALANLGGRLWENGRLDEALETLRRAGAIAPPSAETSSNLGLVLLALGQLVEAEQVLRQAALDAPSQAGIAVNHGTALLELDRFDEAELRFCRVETDHPGSPDADRARFNRATLLLGTGRFRDGWEAFEARRAVLKQAPSVLPRWDGSGLAAPATVLIEAEQGLGDVIQFLRFVPVAMQRAGIVLALPTPLVRLARQSLPAPCMVIATGDPVPASAVARVELLSLPLLLGMDRPFWPGAYLRSEPAPAQGTIGLCWSGSPGYRFDRRRSLHLTQLACLASPQRRFVALQPDRMEEPAPEGMILARPALRDLADTASLIASLELVITVDTAVAHLAGALGRPTLLLNRFGGDWRWRTANQDGAGNSLWYPSLRVIGQTDPLPPDTAWPPVIRMLAGMLSTRIMP